MSMSIGGAGSPAQPAAAPAAATIDAALAVQAQTQTAQSAIVTALFGSLGIGTNTNATA